MEKGTVAVIFVSQRAATDPQGYEAVAGEMSETAAKYPGYRGAHTARGADGLGITVSYWASEEAAQAWKADAAHSAVRNQGRARQRRGFEVRHIASRKLA